MKTLIFEGNSDDTFGEYGVTNDDYDNCAADSPIRWKVQSGELAVIVVGFYSPNNTGCWMIGVEAIDEGNIPDWPIRIQLKRPVKPPCGDLSYRNHLEIDVPDDFKLFCLERGEG